MLSLRRKLPAGVLLTLSHEFHKCGKCERSYDMHKPLPGFCGVKPDTRSASGSTGDFRYAARSKPANASAEGTRGLQEYITNCPEDKAPSRRRGTTATEDWGVIPTKLRNKKPAQSGGAKLGRWLYSAMRGQPSKGQKTADTWPPLGED
jgi:hypothetical protein